jgi:hypothetical protein
VLRQQKDLLDSIVRGLKNEAAQADGGIRRPGSATGSECSASRRDRIEARDDKVLPLFGVPANHVKGRVQARFLKSAKRSSPNSLCLNSAFRAHMPLVAPSGLVGALILTFLTPSTGSAAALTVEPGVDFLLLASCSTGAKRSQRSVMFRTFTDDPGRSPDPFGRLSVRETDKIC